MSWKYLEKPRTVLASKHLVAEFFEMEPAPHDRPLSERRMQVYERILKDGSFRTVTWASVHCNRDFLTRSDIWPADIRAGVSGPTFFSRPYTPEDAAKIEAFLIEIGAIPK